MSEDSISTKVNAPLAGIGLGTGIPERRVAAYLALSLIVAVACAYALIVRADFINYDDNSHVFENDMVVHGLSWKGIGDAFMHSHASLWLPLTWISFMLDVSLFGLNPGAMHAVNLAWHAASTVLIFYTLRRMTGRLWACAFVAALFGLHPLNVESVAWITERKNVLCAFFWIAAINAYARHAARPSALAYGMALFAAALAILSKPMATTLPCTLLLLDFWPLRRVRTESWLRLVGEKMPFFALSAAASWLTLTGLRNHASVSFETVSLAGRISNALVSYATYLGQLFWPVDLGIFYPHPVDPQPMLAGAALLLLAAITAAAIRAWERHPYVLIGWLWFMGTLVPVIGLVQVGSQGHADRFTYIPQIGVFIAVTWLVGARWSKSGWMLGTMAGAVLLACGVLTARQASYWMDEVTLFEHTIAVTRNNACAYANAGLGRVRLADPVRAITHFQTSLRIQPDQSMIWRELGTALLQIEKRADSVAAFRMALQYRPSDIAARYQLGVALRESGVLEEAIQAFQEILRDVPHSAGSHFQLALALEAQGRAEEARAHVREAVRLAPNEAPIMEVLRRLENARF